MEREGGRERAVFLFAVLVLTKNGRRKRESPRKEKKKKEKKRRKTSSANTTSPLQERNSAIASSPSLAFSPSETMTFALARAPVAPSLSARASRRSTVVVRAAAASPRELANKVRSVGIERARRNTTMKKKLSHQLQLTFSLSPFFVFPAFFASTDRKGRRYDVSGRAPRRRKRHW